MTDDGLFSGWGSWNTSKDWDAINKRISQMPEESYHVEPRISRPNIRFSDSAFRIFQEKKVQPRLTAHKAQKLLNSSDVEVIDVSTGFVSNDRLNDTTTERLGLRVGGNYVTIVRYDGKDDYLVDVNGKATNTTKDGIDTFIVDNLE